MSQETTSNKKYFTVNNILAGFFFGLLDFENCLGLGTKSANKGLNKIPV